MMNGTQPSTQLTQQRQTASGNPIIFKAGTEPSVASNFPTAQLNFNQ